MFCIGHWWPDDNPREVPFQVAINRLDIGFITGLTNTSFEFIPSYFEGGQLS
jgi:hypothetical protein